MSLSISNLNLDGWTTEQKFALIEKIWESIPESEAVVTAPDWHREIVQKCVEEDDANPDSGMDWEELKKSLKAER